MPELNKNYIMKNNNNDKMYLYNAAHITFIYYIFLITRQKSNFQSFNDISINILLKLQYDLVKCALRNIRRKGYFYMVIFVSNSYSLTYVYIFFMIYLFY